MLSFPVQGPSAGSRDYAPKQFHFDLLPVEIVFPRTYAYASQAGFTLKACCMVEGKVLTANAAARLGKPMAWRISLKLRLLVRT